MAASSQLLALEAFIDGHPTIKYTAPSSPEFFSLRKIWNSSRRDIPLAIVQPQSPADVSAIIKFAKSNSLPFTIRSGGHNLEGRSLVDNALLIDLRLLATVTVAPDRKTATVGGGILQQELGNKLWEEGLATPIGSVPSVGYAGWAMYGGYGPFSSHWGLGVDQIIGATIVNPDGQIVEADETLLQGIRGAGGLFGVIIDLTIKVYPLTSLLAGPIIFDSTDIAESFSNFNAAYTQLLDAEGLPPQLTIQRVVFNSPHGRVFAVLFVWSGSDSEIQEGQRWSEMVASLGPLKMNAVAPTTIPEWLAGNASLIPTNVYGSSWTHNLVLIPPNVAEAIGLNLTHMPTDPGTMFTVHQLRGPSVGPQNHLSVFSTREPHYMLEFLGYAADENVREESENWAAKMAMETEQADQDNVLPTAYVSLYNASRAKSAAEALVKAYGSNADVVRNLKRRFDPSNAFRLTVPAIESIRDDGGTERVAYWQ